MKRRLLIILAAIGAALLILFAVLWLARAPLAGWAVRHVLAGRGIDAEFDITSLTPSGATIRDLRLNDGAVVIPRTELEFDLGELMDRHVRAVRLTRPQARVRLDEDGASIAGLELGAGGGGPPPVQVQLVSVDRGLITLDSPRGELPMEVDLEGGPGLGWRGWVTAGEGAAYWRGWGADVEVGEAEFEWIGDGALARVSIRLNDVDGPLGAADALGVAATARLSGLEQGVENAAGEAALDLDVTGARAADPEGLARTLTAADLWEDAPAAGPLAAPLVDRLADSLAGFSTETLVMAHVTPEAVAIEVGDSARIEAPDGPDIEIRPVDGPVATWRRDGSGWTARAGLSVEGGPELDAELLEIRFDQGLQGIRFEGSLAPFGDGSTMVGAEGLTADWTRTAGGWRAVADGAAIYSGAAFGIGLRDAELTGAVEVESADGVVSVRPQQAGTPAVLTAAALDTPAAAMSGVTARLIPSVTVQGGAYRVAPDGAPAAVQIDRLSTESMALRDLSLEAPGGGLTLEGAGGQFMLMHDGAPIRFALGAAAAAGGSWTASGVRAGGLRAAQGPVLQRTESGQTFLTAVADPLTVDSFALASGTEFHDLLVPNVRLSGPVAPEMELDVGAPSISAAVDTMGRTGLALQTGAASATLSVAPGAPLTAGFSLEGVSLAGDLLPVGLSEGRMRGRATFADPLQAEIDITRAVVAAPGERPMVTPATLGGTLSVADNQVAITMSGVAEGGPEDLIHIRLDHDLSTGLGQAAAEIPQITFTPGGVQPQDMITALRGLVAEVSGTAEAEFHAQWYGNAARTSGRVKLDGVDMATRFGPIENVSTDFELSSLAPLLTAEPQVVTLGQFNPGLPLNDGEIAVDLLPERRVGLDHARWPFAGGSIEVEPFVWDPAAARHTPVLAAKNLNLGVLVGMFDNQSLNAGGSVSGRAPLVIEEGNIAVDNAVLTGDEDGFVSYAGQAAEAAAQSNEQANLAFRALENLQYRVLELRLNGPLTGQMEAGLKIEGYNPDVLNGYPFKFDINLSADLLRLLRDTTQGFRIRQQIEDSLRETSD